MINSNAYSSFVQQINAEGSERTKGYNPFLFEEIYEYEREDVEELIWDTFTNKNDCELAIFMPQLKKYDGLTALKKKMSFFPFESYANLCILIALYKATYEKEYFDLLQKIYAVAGKERLACIDELSYIAKQKQVYEFLMQVYLNDSDETVRSTAMHGILWADGRLDELDDMIAV
ncbi:MAG: hypothetical protein IJK17_01585 [Lachnospiraceae bacterium]|nr:hypothetical protein [Lachnospiraceae bacterium]